MKICQNCGSENQDNSKYCASCGLLIQNEASSQNNVNQQSNMSQQNNYQQQPFNQQQNPYQNSAYSDKKNMWIAVILDVIGGLITYLLCGIGQLYLGLYKRGIILCVCGLFVILVNMVLILNLDELTGYLISLILGLALVFYSAYDAYLCTNAINTNQRLPLLFGKFDF